MKNKYEETKKQTTVTISPSVLAQAKEMGYNISAFLEENLKKEMKQKMAEQWKKDHKEYFESSNKYIEEHGLPIKPIWERDPNWLDKLS